MSSQHESSSQRYLTIGDSNELAEQTEWGLVCRARANLGDDVSRVRLPLQVAIESGINLLGRYVVTFGDDRQVQFAGLVDSARVDTAQEVIEIAALGWGHAMRRIHGVVKAREVTPPEVAYNVVLLGGMDPSGVQGHVPGSHKFKVTKAVKGLSAESRDGIGGDIVEPLLGSDESAMVRAMRMLETSKPAEEWAAGTIASTGVVADSFSEAVSFCSEELFATTALIQYQWISGDPSRMIGSDSARFRPYWRAPIVSLSDATLARQLDEPKAMVLGRPRYKRRAGRLSRGELEHAIARASRQAAAIELLPPQRRSRLRNAVHLFVRATEARDWSTALLFYSSAADEVASLAPRRRVLTRNDRKALARASEEIFTSVDPRHHRVLELLKDANKRSFREKIADVAESGGIALTPTTQETVNLLYEMRNDLAHVGRYPPSNIFYLFSTGLSVLDQLLASLLRRAEDQADDDTPAPEER